MEKDNFTDPIVPALAIPKQASEPLPSGQDDTGEEASKSLATAMTGAENDKEGKDADISDANIPIADIALDDLPQCPKCHKGLLRPGVVWFGEPLPEKTLKAVDKFVEEEGSKIDLMLVIGTSAKVFPAARTWKKHDIEVPAWQ